MGRLDEFRARTQTRMSAIGGGVTESTGCRADPGSREVLRHELATYLTPGREEVWQWWQMLVQSPYLHTNTAYADAMRRTNFYYRHDENVLNAYACRENGQQGGFAVNFFGGMMRFCRLASLAVAADMCGRPGTAARFAQVFDLYASLSPMDALREMEMQGLDDVYALAGVKSRALAISSGMIISILAHEMGHICLGHVQGPNYYDSNHEISRNREREADSFAATITAASPFGEYMLAGILFWAYAMAQQEKGAAATTHPLSIERFNNFVRANPTLAATFGLNVM